MFKVGRVTTFVLSINLNESLFDVFEKCLIFGFYLVNYSGFGESVLCRMIEENITFAYGHFCLIDSRSVSISSIMSATFVLKILFVPMCIKM